jgi:hypothetical protein
MLRSAHTNAAANERRGATRTAQPPAEVTIFLLFVNHFNDNKNILFPYS